MRLDSSALAPLLAFSLGLLTTAGSVVDVPRGGGSLPLKVVALAFCSLVLFQLFRRRRLAPWPKSFVPLGALVVLCWASNFWTADSVSSVRASRHLVFEVVLLAALAQWVPRRALPPRAQRLFATGRWPFALAVGALHASCGTSRVTTCLGSSTCR